MGHNRFLVGAHDRGARVAHRLGLDHPDSIEAMVLLDIAPTREMYAGTSANFAQSILALVFPNTTKSIA